MVKTARRRRPRKTARIYYGVGADGEHLYWTVKVTDAKKTVHIDSTVADALAGKPGTTIGCHLSKCAKRNSAAFPHDVKLASFTKASCLIVDKIKNGKPDHAWRYSHLMGPLVDLNDRDKNKGYVKAHPEMVERAITLYHPYKNPARPGDRVGGQKDRPLSDPTSKRSVVPKGALARAKAAGLINAELDF